MPRNERSKEDGKLGREHHNCKCNGKCKNCNCCTRVDDKCIPPSQE